MNDYKKKCWQWFHADWQYTNIENKWSFNKAFALCENFLARFYASKEDVYICKLSPDNKVIMKISYKDAARIKKLNKL
jgi:hypothetical protein